MTKKVFDLAVKVGSYTDHTGATKGRYENVGVMLQGDNGPYLMLKRTFNPAGVPSDRESILVSMFEPKGREDRRDDSDDPPRQQRRAPPGDMDDEIPF